MGVPLATAESTSATPTSTRMPPADALGPFDLVEIARIVVIDGRPQQGGEVAQARGRGCGVDGRELPFGIGRKIGLEAVIDHFLPGGGGEIVIGVDHEFVG